MKKILLAVFTLALALGSSMPVYAVTQTTTMPVSVTIAAAVTVSANGLNFGTIVPGAFGATANATITVNATSGQAYTVTMDAGQNFGLGYRRAMSGATHGADYTLHKDAALTTEWGDAGFAGTYPLFSGVAGTGSGAAQTLTVYGYVNNGSFNLGTFTDTITVTVNY